MPSNSDADSDHRSRRNDLRRTVESGGVGLGVLDDLYTPDMVEIYGDLGFDFVWHDLEHGTMAVLGKDDQTYETVGLPRQALSALERYHSVVEPPNEHWPVFPTLHAPTLSTVAREGLQDQADFSEDEIDDVLETQSALELLREGGFVPPAITTDGARRLMRTLSEKADVPGIDSENGEYLELHGGRRGAGDTLVREVGREQAQRLLRHQSPETTMNAYSHISAGEIADDASDAFDEADGHL